MENNLKSNIKAVLLPLEEIERGLNSLKETINKKSNKILIKIKTRHKKEFDIFTTQMNGAKTLNRSFYLLNKKLTFDLSLLNKNQIILLITSIRMCIKTLKKSKNYRGFTN